jgi:hypothetical protein
MREFRHWLRRLALSWIVLFLLLLAMTVGCAVLLPLAFERALHAETRLAYSRAELLRLGIYVALPLSIFGIAAVELRDAEKRPSGEDSSR